MAADGGGALTQDEKIQLRARARADRMSLVRKATGQAELDIQEIIVNLFAGGGGATEGIESAVGRPIDVALNHDVAAISMHSMNSPETEHYTEDVYAVDPVKAARGRPVGFLWASPTCTFFSQAKGGAPLDLEEARKVRGLAWSVVKWAKKTRFSVGCIENVVPFRDWCRLGSDGKADLRYRGEYFRKWVRTLEGLGYKVEWRVIKAHDFGAPTIRERLYILVRCDGQPIVWPTPTHGPGRANPHRTAAEIIDWSIESASIFDRKKPLAEKSLHRIASGVVKYVLANPDPFIVPGAQNSESDQALQMPHISVWRGGRDGHSVQRSLNALTSGQGSKRAAGAAHAMGVVTSEVIPAERSGCVIKYYKTGGQAQDLNDPAHTITVRARLGLVETFSAPFVMTIDHQSSKNAVASALQPLTTLTRKARHMLTEPILADAQMTAAYIGQRNLGAVGRPADSPLSTLTVSGTQQEIVETDLHGAQARIAEETLAKARRVAKFLKDYYIPTKRSPKLIVREEEGIVSVNGRDVLIVDIRSRMLKARECYDAMGFPKDYIIDPEVQYKTRSGRIRFGRLPEHEQIAKCGNAVCPPVAEALVKANYGPMVSQRISYKPPRRALRAPQARAA